MSHCHDFSSSVPPMTLTESVLSSAPASRTQSRVSHWWTVKGFCSLLRKGNFIRITEGFQCGWNCHWGWTSPRLCLHCFDGRFNYGRYLGPVREMGKKCMHYREVVAFVIEVEGCHNNTLHFALGLEVMATEVPPLLLWSFVFRKEAILQSRTSLLPNWTVSEFPCCVSCIIAHQKRWSWGPATAYGCTVLQQNVQQLFSIEPFHSSVTSCTGLTAVVRVWWPTPHHERYR